MKNKCLILMVTLCAVLLLPTMAFAQMHSVGTFDALIYAIGEAEDEDIIEITADITVTEPLYVVSDLVIKSADATGPYTLTRGLKNDNLVMLDISSTVTIENLILDGSGDKGRAIELGSWAELIFEKGAVVQNFESDSNGAGVYIGGGTFIMNGGSIMDNTVEGDGAGVYMRGGTFIMNGGSISGNRSNSEWSYDGLGAGVHVFYGGEFTMNGGSITGNIAENNGGGVYVRESTFIMNGGSIEGNTSEKSGGGVHLYDGTFAMTSENCVIKGNTATVNGGGVYVNYVGASRSFNVGFTMEDGSITGNKAEGDGGGVYVAQWGTSFTMEKGNITGNSAESNGGGIYSQARNINLSGDAVISGNTRDSANPVASAVFLEFNSMIQFTSEPKKFIGVMVAVPPEAADDVVDVAEGDGSYVLTDSSRILAQDRKCSIILEDDIAKMVTGTDVSDDITFVDGSLAYTGAGLKYETATIDGHTGGRWVYGYETTNGSLDSNELPKGVGTYTVTAVYINGTDVGVKTAQFTITPATSSGGSSGKAPSYKATVKEDKNGAVELSQTKATAGSKVTVTVKPEEGYQLDKLIITDAKGNVIEVTENADGTYSFIMPKGEISVDPIFKEVEETVVEEKQFVDVLPTDWYYDAVSKVVAKGWFAGTSESTFNPNLLTTRGMIATILYRMEETPEVQYDGVFQDVEDDAYYTEGIVWGAANEVVKGYGEDIYAPEQNITREQLIAIMYRYATFKGYNTSNRAELNVFVDQDTTSAYAVEALQWAVAEKLISGKGDGTLDPKGAATRGEVASILVRFDSTFANKLS